MGDQQREREREEGIGVREATGFQNICDVRTHNSVATGDQSKFKPAQASKNSKHSSPWGDVFPWIRTCARNICKRAEKDCFGNPTV